MLKFLDLNRNEPRVLDQNNTFDKVDEDVSLSLVFTRTMDSSSPGPAQPVVVSTGDSARK